MSDISDTFHEFCNFDIIIYNFTNFLGVKNV